MQLMELPIAAVLKQFDEVYIYSSGLASHLRSRKPDEIQAFALVPSGTTLDRALEFKRGGFGPMSISQTWLLERIKSLCMRQKRGSFFVQDLGISVENRVDFISFFQTSLFGYADSAYYWSNCDTLNYNVLSDTLGAHRGTWPIAAFSIFPINESKVNFLIDSNFFEELLSGIQEYYFRLYDHESFIIFQNRRLR
jgi:hypothetical protein